ncbi:MAG: hypothetical protein EOM83_02740 [Clostridia bacterium]|nr:hypothetical protein [Clostridia bacterium]
MMKTMMNKNFNIILLALLLMLSLTAKTQQPVASASLDTNSMLIGDQIGFNLQLQLPQNMPFRWPLFADTLTGEIEIVNRGAIDTTRLDNGMLLISQKLTITAFDSGYYVVPPISFAIGAAMDSAVETEPFLLNVFSVAVDTTQTIKPIKGPIEAPLTFAELLPWILLVLAVLLITAALFYYYKKRKKKQPVVLARPKPKVPPHRWALDELEKLRNEKLWQKDLVKHYHSRLSDIIRQYLDDQFAIMAPEMTTPEIMQAAYKIKLSDKNLRALQQILEMADLVKFAKYKPAPDEHNRSMTQAVDFVKDTSPAAGNKTDKMNGSIENTEDTAALSSTEIRK